MSLFDMVCFMLAVAVAVWCGSRLRPVNWFGYRWRYVATPLLFGLWALFLAADAFNGQAEPHHLLAAVGALIWLAGTHATWKNGPPEHAKKPRHISHGELHHVNGGKR